MPKVSKTVEWRDQATACLLIAQRAVTMLHHDQLRGPDVNKPHRGHAVNEMLGAIARLESVERNLRLQELSPEEIASARETFAFQAGQDDTLTAAAARIGLYLLNERYPSSSILPGE